MILELLLQSPYARLRTKSGLGGHRNSFKGHQTGFFACFSIGTIYGIAHTILIVNNFNSSETMNKLKTIVLSLSLFFVAFTLLAQGSETRNPGSFTKIHSGGSWDVIVQTGDRDEVRLESSHISLDKVITQVENNTLKVSIDKGNYRKIGLTGYVTVREIEGIKNTGSGSVKMQSDISSGSLALGNTGSGKIILKHVNAENLAASITGSGDIALSGGSVGELSLSQTGSGHFKGAEVSIEVANISKTGSGQSHLGEVENLNVRATGSGNVYYAGNPGNRNVASTGSSKVIKR